MKLKYKSPIAKICKKLFTTYLGWI